jgi:hypothetical protein
MDTCEDWERLYCSPLRPVDPQRRPLWLAAQEVSRAPTATGGTHPTIALPCLQGRSVAAICRAYRRSPCLYAHWRDRLLAQGSNACDSRQQTRENTRLGRESASLQKRVGALLLA